MMQSYSCPEISIIIPVRNGLPFIKECLESVFRQTSAQWEVLIGDNGSTDGTREYLASLSDCRVSIFNHESNLGISGNLNFLFKRAKAPICQILCADDYFINEASLSTILAYWQSAPSDLGFAFALNEGAHSSLMRFERKCLLDFYPVGSSCEHFFLFGNIPGNLSNVSLRTSILDSCGFFATDFRSALDYEFWARASENFGMGVLKNVLTHIRRHANTASVYLNVKGEEIAEKEKIILWLYLKLKEKYPSLLFFLKLHATLSYDSYYRQIGLKYLLKGRPAYYLFLQAHQDSEFMLSRILKWCVFIISAGGKFGLMLSAKYLHRKMEQHQEEILKSKVHAAVLKMSQAH
ncbi:Glycosyltransferase involved in cell wall bisynthesis [Cnuella takakiae]|uniref:Glycosyltransferase involved in cell wall bisynthesis n=1 Tax=Cnuella takakiae TaxID=1302690 RepID=A0A1M5E1E6_9BACT|nr:glycosyltransferase [Cnuella takakiae]OLY93802.1 hypothetical protein BUE76_19385 [Cnuella takakiae]SHF73067.1 Glycosyltransferase involved in cell wall bisynthesis [Cnuella takakiae]